MANFLADRHERDHEEAAWYGDRSLTLEEALVRAMFTLNRPGVRDTHQWTYGVRDLDAIGARLAANADALREPADFADLYYRIERLLDLGRHAKPLLVYDVANRIGRWLGCRPVDVWLHAGAKNGANALRPGLGHPRFRPLADFPASMRDRLTPDRAEDFLCVVGSQLHPDLWD